MEQMRKSRVVLLTGLLLLALSASTSAADATGATTVDAQQLFHADKLVTDTAKTKTVDARKVEAAAEAAGHPVSRPLLHWDSVEGQSKEAKKSDQPATVMPKAVPIIITAADVEAQNKKANHQTKSSVTVPIQPVVPIRSFPPEVQPGPIAPPVVKPAPVQQAASVSKKEDSRNTVELPPIEPVIQKASGQTDRPAKKMVALPPIEPVPAASIKSAAAPVSDIVELPPIRPVKTSR